ncbi:2EXR domain-containing protein [Aspergillus aculeatinus CBS 121060]|uniref:Uncharacterized protein n=1 Tax=Aspergillus aculeatinus CBS 121060 TaxID=1448322 RepID=A0ACD1H4A7_9EURO|nr:hypothetical protein BO66DRAFT_440330 [Aspergillus aculeatinus CBS 121060]RAH68413.1 hypothetical protein BO66DRAFT_440330 [Aspergillus aculeatinus CBS 121060]
MATSESLTFSRLPAEIRLMIWEAALPDPIGKPLFFWRRAPWRPAAARNSMGGDYDLIHPDDMGHFKIEIPLLQVNKEAERVAKEWIQRQLPPLTRLRTNQTAASRRFNAGRDVVFCTDNQFPDFVAEVENLYRVMGSPDARKYIKKENLIRTVALPQQILEDHPDKLQQIFRGGIQAWCHDLYIIVDAPADLRQIEPGSGEQWDWQVPQRWELEVLEDLPRAWWIGNRSRGGKWLTGCFGRPGSCPRHPRRRRRPHRSSSSSSVDAYERAENLLDRIVRNAFPQDHFKGWLRSVGLVIFDIYFARVVKK